MLNDISIGIEGGHFLSYYLILLPQDFLNNYRIEFTTPTKTAISEVLEKGVRLICKINIY